MQLYISNVSKQLTHNDLFEHFTRYGRIRTLKIVDNYAYVTFAHTDDALDALKVNHRILGHELSLEEMSRSERCDYCDRCPVHGSRRNDRYARDGGRDSNRDIERGHPRDKFKLVMMGIPTELEEDDIKEFVRSYGFEPVFIRITKNRKFGIVEFNNVDEKEEALLKLNDKGLLGVNIQVRDYKMNDTDDRYKRPRYDDDRRRGYGRNDDRDGEDRKYEGGRTFGERRNIDEDRDLRDKNIFANERTSNDRENFDVEDKNKKRGKEEDGDGDEVYDDL